MTTKTPELEFKYRSFNESLHDAFSSYRNIHPSSFFGKVVNELREFNKKAPGEVDLGESTTEISEATREAGASTTTAIEDLTSATTDRSLDVNHLMELDADQLQQLGLDSTITQQLAEVTAATAKMFNTAHGGYKGVENFLQNVTAAHQDYFIGVQKNFGGTADLTRESHISMSNDLIETYENIGKQVLMTNEELADNPLLRADQSLIPSIMGGKVQETLENQANAFIRIVGDPAEVVQRYSDLVVKFGKTYQEQFTGPFKNSMVEVEVISRGLGLETEQIGKIISRSIDRTGEASVENFKNITRFAIAAEKTTGKSSKIIVENMSDIIADVQRFGNVTEQEAINIGTQLAQIGIEAETLGNLISKFTDFDTAASAVGNLTAAFGLNVDAMEMMMLANTDQEAFLMRMRDQFEEQGLAFEDMNLAQQKLLAGQLGIGIEEAARLFDFDKEVTSLEDLRAAQEEITDEDAFSTLRANALSFSQTGDDLQAKIDKTNSFGIGSKIVKDAEMARRALRETGEAIGTMAARGQQAVTTNLFNGIKEGYDNVESILNQLKEKLANVKNEKTKLDIEEGKAIAEVTGVAFSDQVIKDAPVMGKAIGTEIGPHIVIGVKPDNPDKVIRMDEDGNPIESIR